MKKLITQACSILPALVLVSCSSLSIEDVQVYKGQTDPAIVNKGLHKLMDYTKNPVENPVVFAYALEVGADLVHNQRQGIDPKINRDNELISNRFGQHIILTEVALRKDREKLLENGYTPKTAESMVKPWTLYSLSKMDREKYFYTYWQHLGEEPYLYDLNVQYAAMQGLGAKRDDFVRNNAMAIMLLQKTSRALVAVGEKHQNLADYLIEKALRLRTLNYVLNELYNKDKYEVEDKDQQLNILVQWAAKYIHYKIEHKQFVKSEQQDLQDSFHILAKIATNRSLPIASKSAYDQLLDWDPLC